jgi:glutamine---fructose-6-phosphate transaminase (isomerizing)
MHAETLEIGATVRRQSAQLGPVLAELAARLRATPPRLVVTCARGSSDHAASFAKYVIERQMQVMVASHAPSASSLFGTRFAAMKRTLFIAISQSGGSPDIVRSIEAAREAGALTVAVVNVEGSPAAEAAEVVVPILAGPELAVAATKSCAGAMTAILALVAAWSGDEQLTAALAAAPERLDQAAQLDWERALEVFQEARSLFTIGRGLTFGIAMEAALKLKETCQLHAEGFSAAEVRHGPMALVGPQFPVLLFPPDDLTHASFPTLATEFAARGALVLAADSGAVGASLDGATPLPVPPPLHPMIDPVIQLTAFYRFADQLSRTRGLNPDTPPFLAKVTKTQ